MSAEQRSVARVWALMEEIGIAMVVTQDIHADRPRARPMAAHLARDENAVFFLTDVRAGKVEEIDRDENACLAFSDVKAQKYVSVTGRANLSNDRDMIRRLWSAPERAFWSDASDPAIRVLRFTPEDAEYWESPATIVTYVKMIATALTGAKPKLHDNQKVSMSGSSRN